MYSFIGADILRKRIDTPMQYQDKITAYGYANLYPQLMDELYKRSPLTKQAIHVLTEFCMGEGWKGKGDQVVNRFGQTFNDMLRLSAMDLNTFNGFALHFNFNGTGKITEIQPIPFPYVRFSLKNNQGLVSTVKVSNNWEEDAEKTTDYKGIDWTEYPIFNPKTGGINALRGGRGQVMYWTPKMFTYPLASFDAIRDSVQTDAEIQTFMLKNIQNGFLGMNVFKYPGGFDSDEERKRVERKVKDLTGAYNANSSIIAETPEDFTGTLVEPVPANNNDRLFDATGQKIVNTILQNFGVPGPLLAVNPQGSVFTQEQIRDSYILMNLRTQSKRKILERAFEPVAKLFGVRLGEIEQIPWEIPGVDNMPKLNGDPNQELKPKKEEEPEEDKEEAKLRKLYG